MKEKGKKLKEAEEETHKKIKEIKKEIDGLKEQLLLREREEDSLLQKKIFIP